MSTIREIVKEYLEKNGYDGLYIPGECACWLDDLMSCSEPGILDCKAGYKQHAIEEAIEKERENALSE